MSNLYTRSFAAMDSSKYMLTKAGEDDAYLDLAAFHAQQSLEFLLKYIIECIGLSYPKTHRIGELYEVLEQNGFTFAMAMELSNAASDITAWETESRYGSGCKTTKGYIEKCYKIIESLDEGWKSYSSSGANSGQKLSNLFKDAEG